MVGEVELFPLPFHSVWKGKTSTVAAHLCCPYEVARLVYDPGQQ